MQYTPSLLPEGTKIGLFGGGQLAQMIILEAIPYGLKPLVLSPDPKDPAGLLVDKDHHFIGDPNDSEKAGLLVGASDLITFESEFYDMKSLHSLSLPCQRDGSPPHIPYIFPHPHLMEQLQHRWKQKNLLETFKIPTAPFLPLYRSEDLDHAREHFQQNPLVMKKSQGGYDGYATHYVRNPKELRIAKKILHQYQSNQPPNFQEEVPPFIVETLVPFKNEMALILVRSRNGSWVQLPLVETHQVDHRCDWVLGPAPHHPALNDLVFKIHFMMEKLDYVGALGVELFNIDGQLWVNELAPRVHNTGHYSQEALSESQFLLHIKAGLGEELHPPQLLSPAFCMVNLIGLGGKIPTPSKMESRRNSHHPDALGSEAPPHPPEATNSVSNLALDFGLSSDPSSNLGLGPGSGTKPNIWSRIHWYGKTPPRSGRKMGHINFLAPFQGPQEEDWKHKLLSSALQYREKMEREGGGLVELGKIEPPLDE